MTVRDNHRPGTTGQIMIWEHGEARQVEYQWGLRPFQPGGPSYSLLRSEGRSIERPCLIIAHEVCGNTDSGKPYRASLADPSPFMCLAGVWQPAQGDWPAAYAALTVEAYPDLAPFKDRHIAVVRQEDWYDWLQGARPFEELLRPFPAGSFNVKGPRAKVMGDLFT